MKAPYSFPLKSRAAMVDYLLDRRSRSYDARTFRFCWNVKTYHASFDGDSLRKHEPKLNPKWDSVWDMSESEDWIYEDAHREISENEWTSYPGDDQGEWEFSFAGRSGGWIVLEKWRGHDLRNPDLEDFAEWDFADLRAFYRGIVCADSDFTPAKACAEVEYQAAFYRGQWEELRADEDNTEAVEFAAFMEASRPDLYQGAPA